MTITFFFSHNSVSSVFLALKVSNRVQWESKFPHNILLLETNNCFRKPLIKEKSFSKQEQKYCGHFLWYRCAVLMIQEEVRSMLFQLKPDRNSDSDMQIRT